MTQLRIGARQAKLCTSKSVWFFCYWAFLGLLVPIFVNDSPCFVVQPAQRSSQVISHGSQIEGERPAATNELEHHDMIEHFVEWDEVWKNLEVNGIRSRSGRMQWYARYLICIHGG